MAETDLSKMLQFGRRNEINQQASRYRGNKFNIILHSNLCLKRVLKGVVLFVYFHTTAKVSHSPRINYYLTRKRD